MKVASANASMWNVKYCINIALIALLLEFIYSLSPSPSDSSINDKISHYDLIYFFTILGITEDGKCVRLGSLEEFQGTQVLYRIYLTIWWQLSLEETFLVICKKRDKKTLHKLIARHVEKGMGVMGLLFCNLKWFYLGCTIHTDQWKGYYGLGRVWENKLLFIS